QAVRGAKVRDVLLDQHLGHGTRFHVGERECGCPFGEVVRQDQDVPVPRWGLFQRPKNVHANTLQRVSRSHGLHWRTVVLGWALPPCALCARAAPCVHVTTHPVPVESAPESCQQGSRHQRLLSPFFDRESRAMSPDETIFIHRAAPLHACACHGYTPGDIPPASSRQPTIAAVVGSLGVLLSVPLRSRAPLHSPATGQPAPLIASTSEGNYGPCAIGIVDRKDTNGTRARPIPSRAFLSESRNTDAQPCFPFPLAQHRPKAVSAGVHVDDELPMEVRIGEDRRRRSMRQKRTGRLLTSPTRPLFPTA
ncbi:hypothetical protein T03_16594, partial [Trichinella britovi]